MNKKVMISVAFVLFLATTVRSQAIGKLMKTKFSEEISGLVPSSMFQMSAAEVITRLPSTRTPLAAYTDDSRNIDFSVNVAATRWAQADIAMAKEFYKANLFHLYDEVNILNEGIEIVDKRTFAVFEFESLVKGDGLSKKNVRKYTYIQYTIKDNDAYVFAFNAPVQLRQKWATVAKEMMANVKVK